jgi:hypothetical protein
VRHTFHFGLQLAGQPDRSSPLHSKQHPARTPQDHRSGGFSASVAPRPVRGRAIAALSALALILAPAAARADIFTVSSPSYWLAGQYTVFALGSNIGIGSMADDLEVNTAKIYGNVALGAGNNLVAGLASHASFQKGFIQGSLFIDGNFSSAPSYARVDIVNKNFNITGTIDAQTPAGASCTPGGSDCTVTRSAVDSGTDLVPAVQAAIDASAYWGGQSATGLTVNLNGAAATQTVSAAGGKVYNLTSFYMNSGARLTIQGGANDYAVFNVSQAFDFQKSFILLSGGITWDRVLFNVVGTGADVEVSGDNSVFSGSILAVHRNILVAGIGEKIAGSGFYGRVIGSLSDETEDRRMRIYSGATLMADPDVSPPDDPPVEVPGPATVLVLASGLLGLAAVVRRRRSYWE